MISTFNPYLQIFPELSEQMKGAARLKERLPSIVVEPSEESGEQNSVVDEEEEEEDPFQDRCDPAGSGQEEQADGDRSVPALHRIALPVVEHQPVSFISIYIIYHSNELQE